MTLRLGLATPEPVAADARPMAAELAADPGDELGWCRLHQLEAYCTWRRTGGAGGRALRLALARARAMNSGYEEDRLLCAICEVAQWAPVPVQAGLDLCATLVGRFADNRALLIPIIVTRGARWRRLEAPGRRRPRPPPTSATCILTWPMPRSWSSGFVESLAGAHGKAEQAYRRALASCWWAGPRRDTRALEADIARELFSQDRVEAAEEALARIAASGVGLGLRTQIA